MIIDLDALPISEVKNFINGEGSCVFNMFQDETNKIFKLTLNTNCSVGFHKHETSQEIIYLLSGEVIVNDDGIEHILKPGQITCCKINHSHCVKNISDKPAILICSVTQLK